MSDSLLSRIFGAAARLLSPGARTAVFGAVLTYLFANAALRPVFLEPPPVDEITWAQRSLTPWWFPYEAASTMKNQSPEYRLQYYWCLHHPTVARIVYGSVLRGAGFGAPPEVEYDYKLSRIENLRLGNNLPYEMRVPLRITNAVFVLGAVLLAYFGLLRVHPSRALAAASVLPIIYEPTIAGPFNSAVGYVGADAVLLFMLAAFWFAWLALKDRGLAGVLVLGAIAGATTATKLNGALVIAGAVAYYAICGNGWQRLWRAAALCAVAGAVFLALNPIYFRGDLAWAWKVFADTVRQLMRLRDVTGQESWVLDNRREVAMTLFPYLPFVIPLAALALDAGRRAWFAPTFFWAGAIIAGNLAGVKIFLPTYAAPVRFASIVAIMAITLSKIADLREKRPEADATSGGGALAARGPGAPAGAREAKDA